jgi:hypothetical protein
VFIAFEYISERYPETCPDIMASGPRWSPASLPPLDKESAPGIKPRSLTGAIAEFVVQFCLLVWLLLIPSHPFVLLGPGAGYLEHSSVRLAYVSVAFFWAVVGLNMIQLVWQSFNFMRGTWRIPSRVQHLVTKALGIVPVAILAFAPGHRYLELNPSEAARLPNGFNFVTLNQSLFGGVLVVLAIVSIQFVWDIWKTSPSARAARLRMVF